MAQDKTPSPFDWKAAPSAFAKDPALNGINARRSRVATQLKKVPFELSGRGRDVVKKTKELYGL